MEYVVIEAKREGYAVDQCGDTMTIRQLISYLEQYEDDQPIYISNDDGYTYGSIKGWKIKEEYDEGDE